MSTENRIKEKVHSLVSRDWMLVGAKFRENDEFVFHYEQDGESIFIVYTEALGSITIMEDEDEALAAYKAEEKKICEQCKYFHTSDSDDLDGVCERYPPNSVMGKKRSYSIYPEVMSHWSCGEFKRRIK